MRAPRSAHADPACRPVSQVPRAWGSLVARPPRCLTRRDQRARLLPRAPPTSPSLPSPSRRAVCSAAAPSAPPFCCPRASSWWDDVFTTGAHRRRGHPRAAGGRRERGQGGRVRPASCGREGAARVRERETCASRARGWGNGRADGRARVAPPRHRASLGGLPSGSVVADGSRP